MHQILLIAVLLQAPLQFDAASVKPNLSGPGPAILGLPPSGRVNLVNVTLRSLLRVVYNIQDHQIIGGPDWLNKDRFDIQAAPPSDFKPEPFLPCAGPDCPFSANQIMMQRLLADRFQLKTHRETRELPIYELTIAKTGFKLKEVAPPPPRVAGVPPPPAAAAPGTASRRSSALPTPPPGLMMNFGTGFAGSAVPFSAVAVTLTQILARPVIDKTGIKGYYDLKVVFTRPDIPNSGPLSAPGGSELTAADPMPSIFTAVQEEMGLRLDSTKGPVGVFVIDSVQRPSEN
jgi:uncharacterized protein (TIGR03435 family)